jgi:hypothetical protein
MTLGETKALNSAIEQDRVSLRDGKITQIRLDPTSIPMSILQILRPIVSPPNPVVFTDLEEFYFDFQVEWLMLQSQTFRTYFYESDELRTTGGRTKSGDVNRTRRIYSDLSLLFGGIEDVSTTVWSNWTQSRNKILKWLLERSRTYPSLVKRESLRSLTVVFLYSR